MTKSSFLNRILLIFYLLLLLLSVAVVAQEVMVLGGQLVPVQTFTQKCRGNWDCCKAFYDFFTENGKTFIVNPIVSITIQPTHSSSNTIESFICSITEIPNLLANIFMYKAV